jgi:site-specific DNA-methyltransferase (adenine-specific)
VYHVRVVDEVQAEREDELSNIELIQGDCLDVMRGMGDKSVDAVITDPPYGINKAEWDKEFPTEWYKIARNLGKTVITITGSSQIKYVIPMVGDDFIDIIAARNLNGMTFSPLGFGNWLSAVVSGEKPKSGITFFEFVVRGEKPDHPSPKPIDYMRKLITRVTNEGDTILDPFMGSGTTGVACVQLNRNFIGIEIDPTYFAIAQERIRVAQMQPNLFEVTL